MNKILKIIFLVLIFTATGCTSTATEELLMNVGYVSHYGIATHVEATIKKGSVKVGDVLTITNTDKTVVNLKVDKIKIHAAEVNSAKAGDKVELVFEDVYEKWLIEGAVISKTKNAVSKEIVDPNPNQKLAENLVLTKTANGAFLMAVEDVFNITGKGTAVTGTIARGTVKNGDSIQVIGIDETKPVKVVEISKERKFITNASIGDEVTIVLSGVTKDEIERGKVIAKPNSILAKNKVKVQIRLYNEEEYAYANRGYSLADLRYINVWGTDIFFRFLDKSLTSFTSNQTLTTDIQLENYTAIEVGTEFYIRSAGLPIGKGQVVSVLD